MVADNEFKGWAGLDEKACDGHMSLQEFAPKKWDEDDVDVKILYCGICGSDVSSLSGEWGPVKDICPQVCGHEIVGEVVRVGSTPENGLKIGDLVGIGAQSDSCRECEWCKEGKENYCATQTITFNYPYNRGPNGKGSIARGGFAKYWRGPSKFAIPIPSGLEPDVAAPMLCGGVTVYSPLARFEIGTKRKRVGVIGVGGLGHMAILFAKAMGAEVTAISRTDAKRKDAFKLGATDYFATGNNLQEAVKAHSRSLDFILCTINPENFPIADYLPLLTPSGIFCIVGVIPTPLQVPPFPLIMNSACIAGSNIGSPKEIAEMFEFAVKHNVKPWIQKWNFDDINKALPSFQEGDPRYRFVLVNVDNGGKL
ncbi:alcohol dehydrogenase [Cryptococcus deuterogattii LA55]|nr:alcohol dehydrogenase [Cryptococcus deuterogattii LA55]KIR92921.1 alcohol dehydrogenase [Cryptococcus deuterogattii CBS 10090]